MRASERFMRLSGIAGVVGIFAVTAGCGGGGGGSHSGGGSAFQVPAGLTTLQPGITSTLPADGKLIPLVPGDEWYYAVNGFQTSNKTRRVVQAAYLRTVSDGSNLGVVPLIPVLGAPVGAPGTPTDPTAVTTVTSRGLVSYETLTGITEQWTILFDDNTQINKTLSTYVTPLNNAYVEWADTAKDLNLEYAGNNQCETFGSAGSGFSVPVIPLLFTPGTSISGGSSFNVPSNPTGTGGSGNGGSTGGSTTPPTSIPAAPSGVFANSNSSSITISWSASAQATSYNIYRGKASGQETFYANTSNTSFIDTNVAANTTYFYQVTAVNSLGESPRSPELAAALNPQVCSAGGTLTGQENRSFAVLGTTFETVTVPAGTFQTWRVSTSEISSVTGETENDTAWWAPQIGSYVKQQVTLKGLDGTTSNYVYQLVAFKTLPGAAYSRIQTK